MEHVYLWCKHTLTHLSVLYFVLERLLQEVEGVFLSVCFDHHLPRLLQLFLQTHTHVLMTCELTVCVLLWYVVFVPPSFWSAPAWRCCCSLTPRSSHADGSSRPASVCSSAADLHCSPADLASRSGSGSSPSPSRRSPLPETGSSAAHK